MHFWVSTGAPLTDAEKRLQDGIHVCVYVTHFQTLYEALAQRGALYTGTRWRHLDTCETYAEALACRQFRFDKVHSIEEGGFQWKMEHETRALGHVQYMKQIAYRPK